MKSSISPARIVLLLLLAALNPQFSTFAQGSGFTYQGRLTDSTNPANGRYDLTFALFGASSGPGQIGPTLTNTATIIVSGLFTVPLDFGGSPFNGTNLWLEISARTNGSGSYTTLIPRQPITPAPYAITASNFTGVLLSASLQGIYNNAVTMTNVGNNFAGNGAALTSLNAGNLGSGTVPDARLSANVALLNRNNQTFTGTNIFNSAVAIAPTTNSESLLNVGGGDWSKLSITTTGVIARTRLGHEIQAGVMSYNALLAPGGWVRDDTNRSSLAYLEHLSNERHEFRVSPAGSGFIPWNTAMIIQTNGNVGIAATVASGQLTVGTYQGGTAGSAVANYGKQVIISGPYNTSYNTSNSVKLLISDYDNDAPANIFPIYVEDENNGVDFFLHSQPGFKNAFFGGYVGIGTSTPAQPLHIRASQAEARLETTNAANGAVLELQNSGFANYLGAINFLDHLGNVSVQLGGFTNGDLAFRAGSVERARITSLGQTKLFTATGANGVVLDPAGQTVSVYDGVGHEEVRLEGNPWGEILLNNSGTGHQTAVDLSANGIQGGYLSLNNSSGAARAFIAGNNSGGFLGLYRGSDGAPTITMTADDGTGSGLITASVLQITGGSDLSEQFDVQTGDGAIQPGMVVCIDADHPGQLVVSTKAYDRTVAGIVSGAGGVNPGLLMGHQGTLANGKHPIALTGRVYCMADASSASIQPGDLLTTSPTAGHAMKVADPTQAQGAILGKAMAPLQNGKGLVLVLVTLQ